MDLRKIKKIITLMEESSLSEIEIVEGDNALRFTRPYKGEAVVASEAGVYPAPVSERPAPVVAPPTHAPDEDAFVIASPIVGTFYRAASPTSDPFVEVGQHINQGDVVCLIEAMKIMNQIKSDVSGTVLEIRAENASAVEFGQPLIVIK